MILVLKQTETQAKIILKVLESFAKFGFILVLSAFKYESFNLQFNFP